MIITLTCVLIYSKMWNFPNQYPEDFAFAEVPVVTVPFVSICIRLFPPLLDDKFVPPEESLPPVLIANG